MTLPNKVILAPTVDMFDTAYISPVTTTASDAIVSLLNRILLHSQSSSNLGAVKMKTAVLLASVWASLCLATDPVTPDKVEADIKTDE